MKFLADRSVRLLFAAVTAVIVLFSASNFLVARHFGTQVMMTGGAITLSMGVVFLILLVCFFHRRSALIEAATSKIRAFLAGDQRARIDCNEEGEIYRLFHEINNLAAILNAHAENQARARVFLKDTLSDISHQLKTPLATLGIYNGIIQDVDSDLATIREFSALSEHELERIENLVKNLLTIARLDAGTLIFERMPQDLSQMMVALARHFAVRAAQEEKILQMTGPQDVTLECDRVWFLEALSNILKNAFDHTRAGCTIAGEWRSFGQIVQITVRDDGSGIHPEDLPHIFKRFYRSRFSKDTEGVGLGLPLAKAIIEAHSGTIDVDSTLDRGTVFTISLIQPVRPFEQ